MARARNQGPKATKPEDQKTDVVEVTKPDTISDENKKQKPDNVTDISGHNKFAKFKK